MHHDDSNEHPAQQPEPFCEMTGGYDDVDHARAAKRLNADLRAMDATPRAGHAPGPWIEYHSGADSQGRRQYTIYWVADYHPGHPKGEFRMGIRGQVYFANPSDQKHDSYDAWPGEMKANAAIARATKGGV